MPEHSDRLNKLARALARAQAQIEPVEPNAIGSLDDAGEERSYRYATLARVWLAVGGPLTRNGLSVAQTCEPGEAGELRLVTTLLHSSGQWISGTTVVPLPAQTPQGYGSALTYARRYGLGAMVGLCVDHDDDGAAGSQRLDHASPAGGDDDREREELAPDRPGAWWKVPCNRANTAQLKAFAQAYARAKGVQSVDREELRRDFGIEGRLVDHFAGTPLGEIVACARALRSKRTPAGRAESEEVHHTPDAEAA